MYIYGNAILIGTENPLHLMLAECIQKVCETEGSILNKSDYSCFLIQNNSAEFVDISHNFNIIHGM